MLIAQEDGDGDGEYKALAPQWTQMFGAPRRPIENEWYALLAVQHVIGRGRYEEEKSLISGDQKKQKVGGDLR